ncbi:hypothetical protein Ddye_016045 [Dipteronia dyeriana]|uniref:Uncharacterized protein n=1 Tax=Dipteronia dyeriana TaxID=168575 RepID=A0AAD9WZ54_9ROSI|nr:hypothetical protein Ddye_016045 [Dipteronia dyeriana]
MTTVSQLKSPLDGWNVDLIRENFMDEDVAAIPSIRIRVLSLSDTKSWWKCLWRLEIPSKACRCRKDVQLAFHLEKDWTGGTGLLLVVIELDAAVVVKWINEGSIHRSDVGLDL